MNVEDGRGIVLGVTYSLVVFVLYFVVAFAFADSHRASRLALLTFYGLTQSVLVGPAIWFFRQRHAGSGVKGLWIVAAIGFLMNVACARVGPVDVVRVTA